MISVIGHAGLGNIIFYYANGLYHAKKYDEPIELIFIDVAKNTVISDGRKESTIKNYAYMGGHPIPRYTLGEFFGIKVWHGINIDEHSKGRPIFHEPHIYSPNCVYNIGRWNYNFSPDDFKINHKTANKILRRHAINFSIPCVHLRLGSIGDNFARDDKYISKLKDYCKTLTKYYVISEDAMAASQFLGDNNAIVIDEPCSLSALYLMSCFDRLAISRSTLGMWGAYLSEAEVTIMEGFEDEWHKPLPTWNIR